MGHGGMMAIGAYFSAVMAKEFGLSPFFTIPLGGIVTFAVAYLVGIPFSRLRGLYFCMITLFFGLGILSVVQMFTRYTGGYAGLTMIPPLFGASKLPYYYTYLFLCIACLLIMYRLENSRLGVTWKAISQSYFVAASIGIDEARQRVFVFAIGSFFAGLSGAAFAHYSLVISQSNFSFLASLNIIIYMLAGGILSFSGPIVGTAILVIIPMMSLSLKYYSPYVFIGILLFVLLFARNGLVGLPQQIWHWFVRLREKRSHNLFERGL